MKKRIVILLILTFALTTVIGCANQKAPADGQKPAPETTVSSNATSANAASPESAPKTGGLTLKDIRKAAEDSGLTVTDDYVAAFMKDVVAGFSVEIVADELDVIYSVLECKTEDAAISNAKDIDVAGYNIAIRNGRFLTCYGVDKKDGTAKDILASIMNGKAV